MSKYFNPISGVGGSSPELFYAFNDCFSTTNSQDWTFTFSGAVLVATDYSLPNSIGCLVDVTTAVGNRYAIASPNLESFQLGQGVAKFVARLRAQTLSNAVDGYEFRVGFIDSITGESTDGVFFRYTDTINGGRFEAVAINNSVATVVDTGVLASNSVDYKFQIDVTANGSSAIFKINNSVVATISTNIPTANGRETGYGLMLLKTVGTTARNFLRIDYLQVCLNFSTPR